jgi:FAD/FMN-containing dehydrogenase
MAVCHRHGQPVVPQGGNTGLVGGATAMGGELVVCTHRLTDVGVVDQRSAQVTVGAGVTLARLQEIARASGLDAPVDLGARGSATVGGMVATNAGGTRAVRFAMMRAHVHGVEAVLADGTIVSRLGGLIKDNTGYDWPRLLAGSEGTLAIISAVRIGLVSALSNRCVVAIGWSTLSDAVHLVAAMRDGGHLWAAEGVTNAGCAIVASRLSLPLAPVFASTYTSLLEVDGYEQCLSELERCEAMGLLSSATTDPVVVGPEQPHQAERLWEVRERHTEAINTLGAPVKLDVTIPLHALDEFVTEVASRCPEAIVFGHIGDGNLHVNIPGLGHPERADEAHLLERSILTLAADLGGSISAEHGIGRAKPEMLHLSRSPEEIGLFRAIKHALDPEGLLNPGCLLTTP